jgi:hypothetical protein
MFLSVRKEQLGSAIMEYRGIKYEIKMATGLNRWVWTVHIPNPKQGNVSGTRERAILTARKAIQAWCYQHPTDCASASAD